MDEYTVSGTVEFTAYFTPEDDEAFRAMPEHARKEMIRKHYLRYLMNTNYSDEVYFEGVTIEEIEEGADE